MATAPVIPYRANTQEERDSFWRHANGLSSQKEQDEFWKQTTPQAEQRAQVLRDMGYVVTDPEGYGSWQDGYGVHRLIMPPNSKHKIAVLSVWESGGFLVEPLRLSLEYEKGEAHMDKVFALREALKKQGILFWHPERKVFSEERARLQQKVENLDYVLSVIQS